jgi:hypothetical protein
MWLIVRRVIVDGGCCGGGGPGGMEILGAFTSLEACQAEVQRWVDEQALRNLNTFGHVGHDLQECGNLELRELTTFNGVIADSECTTMHPLVLPTTTWTYERWMENPDNRTPDELVFAPRRRQCEVHEFLGKQGLRVRSDSKLVASYISGGIDELRATTQNDVQTLDEMAKRIAFADFLYRETPYGGFLRQYQGDKRVAKENALKVYLSRPGVDNTFARAHELIRKDLCALATQLTTANWMDEQAS